MEYNEKQKFKRTWTWIIIVLGISIIGLLGFGVIKQVVLGVQFGDKPMSNFGLISTFLSISLFLVIIYLRFIDSTLITKIDKNKIELKFSFQENTYVIPLKSIVSYEIIKYNPVIDYGDWGLKYGIKGKAYSASGNIGLQLNLDNGEHILIGTQRDKELIEFMDRILKQPSRIER